MNDQCIHHIYHQGHKRFTIYIYTIFRRIMSPIIPMSTKTGYQIPYTKSGSQTHTSQLGTQGAPKYPPQVLLHPEVPHQLGALLLQEEADQS